MSLRRKCTHTLSIAVGAAFIVIAMGVSAAAEAQSADAPTYAVGDTWKRSNGLEVRVVKVEGDISVFTGVLQNCPTCLARVNKESAILDVTAADGKPVDVTLVKGALLGATWKFYEWPIEVKKSWTTGGNASFQGTIRPYQVDIKVVAYEDVKTKAGTFKAFKLQQDWSIRAAQTFTWTTTVWYAPEVKSLVKLISTNRNTTDWELLSYSLK